MKTILHRRYTFRGKYVCGHCGTKFVMDFFDKADGTDTLYDDEKKAYPDMPYKACPYCDYLVGLRGRFVRTDEHGNPYKRDWTRIRSTFGFIGLRAVRIFLLTVVTGLFIAGFALNVYRLLDMLF